MFDDRPLDNANPIIYKQKYEKKSGGLPRDITQLDDMFDLEDSQAYEVFNDEEVFEHIRNLNDPEHPLTLEQLDVVSLKHVTVEDPGDLVSVEFTPTIPHCSMASYNYSPTLPCAFVHYAFGRYPTALQKSMPTAAPPRLR